MRKLPHVTLLFWVIKIIATTLGETGGDLLAQTLHVGYLVATAIFLALFAVAVVFQLKARRFHPALFWTVIALSSTAGTTLSDLMNRTGGIGYAGGALILSTGLAVVFVIWWRSGQTLDVENVASFRGELLFWVAILFSNSLGTSSGDFLADGLGFGFRDSALLLSAIMLVLLAGHYFTRISGVVLFWIAFVLTRPLGATVGDFLSKPLDKGGLAWGTEWTSATLLAVLIALIAYQAIHLRRHPLAPLPVPVHRRTGEPQQPNGALVIPGV
ncbi:membrane protein [Mycolicibacterium tusciae]|uniref:COG4705 family protein n=1 Tax=Mycolicibacterium tusciae TaxID=75922 RepID=UPI00058B2DEE|nr:membrane protein [Mycolicibacterium tusciae]